MPKDCSVGYHLTWMATLHCGRLPPNRDSSSRYWRNRLEMLSGSPLKPTAGLSGPPVSPRSCTVKDFCQLIGVFAFAVEGAANRSEGLRERKNVVRDQQIGILCADRMPVHTISGYGDFRY